eukprot:gene5692-7858_t
MKFRFCGDLDCPDWVLAEISTLSKMSSVRIKVLVVQILSFCVEGEFNYEKVLKLASDNADGISDIKGAIAALHFMITNAAKYDLDEKSFVQEILQLGLPKENTDAIAKQFRENKEHLRTKFSDDSYRVSKLLSVDWRVDHIYATSASKSSNIDESVGPLIHVKLAIDTKPEKGIIDSNTNEEFNSQTDKKRINNIAFELSSAKLDILIHELSIAQKMLENT